MGMQWKSKMVYVVNGETIDKPKQQFIGTDGRVLTSFKCRVDTQTGGFSIELQAWGDKENNEAGLAIMETMTVKNLRVTAVADPNDQLYQDKIQRRANIRELWVEDLASGALLPVVLPKSGEVEVREYKPLDMPETVSAF